MGSAVVRTEVVLSSNSVFSAAVASVVAVKATVVEEVEAVLSEGFKTEFVWVYTVEA